MSTESQNKLKPGYKIVDIDKEWPEELKGLLDRGLDLELIKWLGININLVREMDHYNRSDTKIDSEKWQDAVSQIGQRIVRANAKLGQAKPPSDYRVGLGLYDPEQGDELRLVHMPVLEDRLNMHQRIPMTLDGLVVVLYAEEKPAPESE